MPEQEQLKTFADVMPAVMGRIGYLQKQGKVDMGSGRGYKFASLEQMLDKVNAEFEAQGIFVKSAESTLDFFQPVYSYKDGHEDGRPNMHAVVTVSLTLGRGQEVFGPYEGTGSGADTGDKAVMKASSSALKYALQKCGLISWGDDPEADRSQDPPVEGKAPPKAKEPSAKSEDQAANLKTGIETAESVKQLLTLKPRIVALKGTNNPAYDDLVAAYQAREKALKAG